MGEQNEENQCVLDAVLSLVKLDKLNIRHWFVKTYSKNGSSVVSQHRYNLFLFYLLNSLDQLRGSLMLC